MYGTEPGKRAFANNCLLARRLVERGVRFVQLYHRGWDTHGARRQRDIVNKSAGGSAARPTGRGGADQGPEAARPARLHAGRLGRRVRPHADERGAQRLEVPRARPSPARLHDLDGGRRHQARHHLRRDRRARLQRRAGTRSTSTTCTPPSSTDGHRPRR